MGNHRAIHQELDLMCRPRHFLWIDCQYNCMIFLHNISSNTLSVGTHYQNIRLLNAFTIPTVAVVLIEQDTVSGNHTVAIIYVPDFG